MVRVISIARLWRRYAIAMKKGALAAYSSGPRTLSFWLTCVKLFRLAQ